MAPKLNGRRYLLQWANVEDVDRVSEMVPFDDTGLWHDHSDSDTERGGLQHGAHFARLDRKYFALVDRHDLASCLAFWDDEGTRTL